jgi:hypothetical protein
MLDSPPLRSREIILANMRQSVSLYPRTDLDAVGEGFAVTCSDEEALKLVEDSAVTVGQVVDMLGVDMSLGYAMYLNTSSSFLHVTMLS